MKMACEQSVCFFQQLLDPFAPAAFAVSWAGDGRRSASELVRYRPSSLELTERWHRKQTHHATNRLALIAIPVGLQAQKRSASIW